MAPPVYRPANASVAAPAVYRPGVTLALRLKLDMPAPPVHHRSPSVPQQRIFGPTATRNPVPKAQNRRADPKRDQHAAMPNSPRAMTAIRSPAASPVQRKVLWESLFHDYDDAGGEPVSGVDLGKWVEFQSARGWYETADTALSLTIGSLLPQFENEPNLMLVITEDPGMKWEHLGETYMHVWVGHWEMVGSSNEDIWTEPLSEGADVTITVAITQGETAEKIAHTLNHEMALHATKFLEFTRMARKMRPVDIGKLGRSMLQNYCHHHKNIKDPGHRVNQTHAKLMLSSGSLFSPANLKKAYFDDYELYDEQGVTSEPREGHSSREDGWVITRLSARSPVARVNIGDTQVVYYKQLRIKVHREGEKRFRLWFESGQKNPYYVRVLDLVD